MQGQRLQSSGRRRVAEIRSKPVSAPPPDPMPSSFTIGLSGLRAAQAALDSSAHNIANLATPGFRRQTLEAATLPQGGGVVTQLGQAAQPGPALETDLVAHWKAEHQFSANWQTVRAGDTGLGYLLDIQA